MTIEGWWHARCFAPKQRKRGRPMSVQHILLAALLLAVPISMKYVLAFEVRKMVATLKGK